MDTDQRVSRLPNWLSHWRLSLFLPGYVVFAYLFLGASGLVYSELGRDAPLFGLFQAISVAMYFPLAILCMPWMEVLNTLGLARSFSYIAMPNFLAVTLTVISYGAIGHVLLWLLPDQWKQPKAPIRLWMLLAFVLSVIGGLFFLWALSHAEF